MPPYTEYLNIAATAPPPIRLSRRHQPYQPGAAAAAGYALRATLMSAHFTPRHTPNSHAALINACSAEEYAENEPRQPAEAACRLSHYAADSRRRRKYHESLFTIRLRRARRIC